MPLTNIRLEGTISMRVECPGCGCVLSYEDRDTIYCSVPACDYYGMRFKQPKKKVQLVPVKKALT